MPLFLYQFNSVEKFKWEISFEKVTLWNSCFYSNQVMSETRHNCYGAWSLYHKRVLTQKKSVMFQTTYTVWISHFMLTWMCSNKSSTFKCHIWIITTYVKLLRLFLKMWNSYYNIIPRYSYWYVGRYFKQIVKLQSRSFKPIQVVILLAENSYCLYIYCMHKRRFSRRSLESSPLCSRRKPLQYPRRFCGC